MYKRFLIAVDLSEQTEQILATAQGVIELHNADYEVMFVYQAPVYPWGEMSLAMPPMDFDGLKASLQDRLEEVMSAAGLDAAKNHFIEGDVEHCILARSKKHDSDLLIIGSHGVNGVQALLGSTSDRILHQASCDVLAIRIRD